MDPALVVLGLGVLILLALVFAVIFRRYRVPDVLFLFLIGLTLGPVLGLVQLEDIGALGSILAVVTLVVVLFEAGLDLRVQSIFSSVWRALALMLITLIGTVAIVAPLAVWLFEADPLAAAIAGVLVGSVSSGIGVPLIRRMNVQDKTKTLLTLESNLNDVVSIVLVLALIRVLDQGTVDVSAAAWDVGQGFAFGIATGVIFAVVWSYALGRIRGIQNSMFATPALVLILYGVTESIGGSGPVAALVFGVTLGSLDQLRRGWFRFLLGVQEFRLTERERRLFSGMVFLLKAFFFVYIGISMDLAGGAFLAWGAGVTVLLFVLRTVTVRAVLARTLPAFDVSVLARLLPKGLVGAALITLVGDPIVRDIAYPIILFSILYTSILVPLARRESAAASRLAA